MNPDKTETFSLAKPSLRKELGTFLVGSLEVNVLNEIKTLGVIIDMNWNAAVHINKLTQTCYFVLR